MLHWKIMTPRPLVTLVLAFSSVCVPVRASLIIGGFDSTRGGFESVANSSVESDLRDAITGRFPGVTFSSTGTLTAPYLSGVNVLLLGVAQGDFAAISPLTAAEQTALLSFVDAGGTAVLFADNSDFDLNNQAPAANASFLSPFGLAADGTLTGNQSATFLSGGGSLDTYYPTDFSTLGGSTELAAFTSNGQPAAAYFPRGALMANSGAVVFFADSSMMLNGFLTPNDATAILNAIALEQTGTPGGVTTPEPASWLIAAAGLALTAGLKKLA